MSHTTGCCANGDHEAFGFPAPVKSGWQRVAAIGDPLLPELTEAGAFAPALLVPAALSSICDTTIGFLLHQGVGSGGEVTQAGQGGLLGMVQQVADEAADGCAGADLAGCGAFGGQQGLISAAGFVPLGEAQGDVDEEPGAAFGVGELAEMGGLGVVQGGASVAEHVVGGHAVADHVGGQRLLLGWVVGEPLGGGVGLVEEVGGAVVVAGAGGAIPGRAHQQRI